MQYIINIFLSYGVFITPPIFGGAAILWLTRHDSTKPLAQKILLFSIAFGLFVLIASQGSNNIFVQFLEAIGLGTSLSTLFAGAIYFFVGFGICSTISAGLSVLWLMTNTFISSRQFVIDNNGETSNNKISLKLDSWFVMILTSLVGGAMGLHFALVITLSGPYVLEDSPWDSMPFAWAMVWVVAGIVFGYTTGIFQGFILRHRIPRMSTWIVASTIGWGLGMGLTIFLMINVWGLLGEYWPFPWKQDWILIGTGSGVIAGITQWLVLRRNLSRSGWWVLISMIVGMVGWSVLFKTITPMRSPAWMGGILTLGGGIVVIMLSIYLQQKLSSRDRWVWNGMVIAGVLVYSIFFISVDYPALAILLETFSYSIYSNFPISVNMGGLVSGAITGVALVWLLRQNGPIPDSTSSNGEG